MRKMENTQFIFLHYEYGLTLYRGNIEYFQKENLI